MLSGLRSSRPLLTIAMVMAILGTATMAFAGADVTTPRAIPYLTSNVATGLGQPTAIAIDDNGNIYVGDNYTGATAGSASAVVRKIDATTGQVTVFAGGAAAKATTGNSTCANPDRTVPGGGDIVGDGCPATSAWFGGTNGGVRGLAVWNNYLYIEDLGGYFIHRVNLTTNIMELVGGGPTSTTWTGDAGPVVVGSDVTKNVNLFKPPTGFAVDPLNGNVYFGAGGTNAATIRMISSEPATCANAAAGILTAPCIITIVNYKGQATAPAANACIDPAATLVAKDATVNFPQGLAFDGNRNLYIAENKCGTVRKLTKNPNTNIVDQNSTFSTLVGNNITTGTSPSWYDTTAAPAFFGAVRGLASAGGNNLYLATTTAVYFYDATTGWAHRIWGEAPGAKDASLNFICTTNTTSPYIGCPAPWATRTDNSGTGAMALDKAGNLYVTDYTAGAVEKAALGTDFIGIAPPATRSLPTTQYVLVHGGAVTNATADAPFSALLTTDTVPKPGCNSYVATGDNGTDCVMAVKYSPSVLGTETGLLHVAAAVNVDLQLQGLGNPATSPQVSLTSDKSVCAVAGACSIMLTATVTPGSNPASTGLAVSGDVSACTGGSTSQAFQAAGSNTFTYTCSLPTLALADFHLGPVDVTDDQARTGHANSILVSVIDPPVAQPQSVRVTYNTPKAITLNATGTGVLTYAVVSQPAHGTLSGTEPALTYTPNTNYVGSDSFTFRAANGVDSTAVTVTITVLPAAPVATEQSLSATFNGTTQITLAAAGTGTLTYAIVRPPAHGALANTPPNVSYTPDLDYSGPDSFTFKATDEDGQESVPATVLITVLSVVPEAQNQSVVVTSNVPKPIRLVATGMGTLTYTILTQPTHGALSGTAPDVVYTPSANYLGPDSFTFKATSNTDSAPATVSIMVLPAPPVAASQSVTVNYASSIPITLAATGSGALTYTVVAQPTHGTLSGTAPNLTYTAAANFNGTDTFIFKATDSDSQDSAPATVTITVLPASPTAAPQSVTVTYNTAKPIILSATGTGTLTYTVVAQPAHGTLSGTAPDLIYTPASNYNGSDSFTFKAADIHNQESAVATISIDVMPAVPVANAQSVSATYNAAKPITLSATGTGTLTYAVVSQPSHGTLAGTAPAVTYTPASNYLGSDSFTFKVTDGHGQESPAATVSISVVPPVPVATAQSVTVTYNTAKPITLTGTGMGTLTYTVVSQPAHGTLSGTAPSLTFTPTDAFSGSDSFTFKVVDSNSQESAAGTVSITVASPDITIVPVTGGSTTATVNAGNLAVFNLQVIGWSGASGPISFSCSGAPTGANCAVSSNSATLNGTKPIAISVSVQTMGPVIAASTVPSEPTKGSPWGTTLMFAVLLSGMVSLKNRKMQLRLASACATVALVCVLCSCGGNSLLGANGANQTTAGTYTVTVTAKSGDVTKTIPLTLNVR